MYYVPVHTVLTSTGSVTLQYVYLCCVIELFQYNTPQLVYFEGFRNIKTKYKIKHLF